MKDALIIFIVGLFTIVITLIAIDKVKDYRKQQKRAKIELVCKEGGIPDWQCLPNGPVK